MGSLLDPNFDDTGDDYSSDSSLTANENSPGADNSQLSSMLLNTANGMMPVRDEVLKKRQLLDQAMQKLAAAQRAPQFGPNHAINAMAHGFASPLTGEGTGYQNGPMSYNDALEKEYEGQHTGNIAGAGTESDAAKIGTGFDQQDTSNAMGMIKEAGSLENAKALNDYRIQALQEKGLKILNGPDGRPAAYFDPLTRQTIPLSGPGAGNGMGGSPFGTNLTKSKITSDEMHLKDARTGADNLDLSDAAQNFQTVLDKVKANPNIGPSTQLKDGSFLGITIPAGLKNELIPGAPNIEDTKALQTATGNLQAQAMLGAKNIRNQREFDAVAAGGQLAGGNATSMTAQAAQAYGKILTKSAYADFIRDYKDTHGELTGADAVWNKFLMDNPLYTKDTKGNITGINKNIITGSGISPSAYTPYVDAAPRIYQRLRGQNAAPAGEAPSSSAPTEDRIKVMTKNGQSGSIDKAHLADFIHDGGKVVQ